MRGEYCCILFCAMLLLTIQGSISISTFEKKAIDTFNLVQQELQIHTCVSNAKAKAKQVTKVTSGDKFYAVAWIRMYSGICKINQNLLTQNRKYNNFPFRLNLEARCLRNTQRNQDLSSIFVKVRDIIDESLEIIGSVEHSQLYRGVTTCIYEDLTQFVDESFFSTTSSITPALRFAQGVTLFIIENMKGTKIENYVENRFRYQKEVLGQYGKTFRRVRIVENQNEIKQIVDSLNPDWSKLTGIGYPKKIVYITQEGSDNNKATVSENEWSLMSSYCSENDNTRRRRDVGNSKVFCSSNSKDDSDVSMASTTMYPLYTVYILVGLHLVVYITS